MEGYPPIRSNLPVYCNWGNNDNIGDEIMDISTDATGTVITLLRTDYAQMTFQFQVYEISAVLLLIAAIGILLLFWYVGALPFFVSRLITHDIVIGIMDKTTRTIKPNSKFKKRNGIYFYNGQPLPFVKCYPGNFLFAGMPFDILDIDLAVIESPVYQKACRDLISAGYPNINALEKAVMFSQMKEGDPRVDEMILREGYDNYKDACLKINPQHLTVESPIIKQFFTSLPLSDLIGYGTEVPSEDVSGEVDDIYEANKPSARLKRELAKMIPICILIFAACAGCAVLYMVFFKG